MIYLCIVCRLYTPLHLHVDSRLNVYLNISLLFQVRKSRGSLTLVDHLYPPPSYKRARELSESEDHFLAGGLPELKVSYTFFFVQPHPSFWQFDNYGFRKYVDVLTGENLSSI